MNRANPLGLLGLELVELSSADPSPIEGLLRSLGFSRVRRHGTLAVDSWRQNDVHFLVSREPDTHASAFAAAHGPSVSALGLRVEDANHAFAEAVRRGARPLSDGVRRTLNVPAIYGIGGAAVYFFDAFPAFYDRAFTTLEVPETVPQKGFLRIDHLTNNVPQGELSTWASYYKDIFGFTEVRSFDIRGEKSGLYSYALRSPCGTFCIPINEDKGNKGQIAEYLKEYRGAGVQHIAFLTEDLLSSIDALGGKVALLDIDPSYYEEAFARVPHVRESKGAIRARNVLVDGDDEGYLLQIFTKNCIGPIFFELIQRRNHLSFGEGNFGALFRSIERDQERRGVL